MENDISINEHGSSLLPNSGSCYDYYDGRYRSRKTIWMVPHVIKFKEDSQIITWRCNWGNTCESKCLYAMLREKNMRSMFLAGVGEKVEAADRIDTA
jgi:hypothetical protein